MKDAPRSIKKVEGLKLQICLGDTIKRMRKCGKVSQQELADLLSIHQTAVSRVESGQQNLLPWQLQQLSEYFGVRVDAMLAGRVNYWALAERFGLNAPLPQNYREIAYSRVREVLPLLGFVLDLKGEAARDKMLASFGIEYAAISEPDQPISVQLTLDLFRELLSSKILTDGTFQKLIDQTRSEAVHGFLHPIYQTHESVLPLIITLVSNAHHYQRNFSYEISGLQKDRLELSIEPTPHMNKVLYRDEVLGDVLCRYRKAYIAQFPKYIGRRPLEVSESECMYHGAERCLYRFELC